MSNRPDFYRQVASLHFSGINRGFLSSLGVEFLALLYEAIDASSSAVLIIECKEMRVVGFVAGAEHMTPIYLQLLARPHRLLLALAPVLLRPRKIWSIFELLAHNISHSWRHDSSSVSALPNFELLSISVSLNERRSGVAKRLYGKLVAHAQEQGISAFRILVGSQLDSAHRFYQTMGATPAGEAYVHGDEKSVVYVQQVPKTRR